MNIPNDAEVFDRAFRDWVRRTCEAWDYQLPSEDYYFEVYSRLPFGLRATLSGGLKRGLLLDVGQSKTGSAGFRPKGVMQPKGPYSWFERDSQKKQPRPTWEYYVQVAEYMRLTDLLVPRGCRLTFEDSYTDISLYIEGERPVVCYEVKEQAKDLDDLIRDLRRLEEAIDWDAPDRHDDALRKAKYIVQQRPSFYVYLAIGARREFRVDFPEGKEFQLTPDIVPEILFGREL